MGSSIRCSYNKLD
jgi:hypothetical protein